ncbi:hypothetical protein [Flavobacterium poyangense]|uniref:hypothetical protein n=1 Tax=Flavobacterium poyangense TaxID=2204302 RepID=UPI001422D5A9|nr:hypothetical protein [Flavobacterium sp. JXAS1]
MIDMYREPAAELIKVPWHGIVLDRGVLKKAIKNSRGEYLFSETGAGVQPLIVIGTLPEIVDFFYSHKETIISNEIKSLPDIYIGVSKFLERSRYDGTFPIQGAINALTKSILDFVPGSTIIDVLSNATTFGTILKDILNGKSKMKQTDLLYLKISYINDSENNGKKIGTGKTSFDVIFRYLLDVKETPV